MKTAWLILVAGSLFLGALARGAGGDVRFSRSLSAEEKSESGITRFDSDQVAVLDALIRRNMPSQLDESGPETSTSPFSERLTENERRISGLTLLNEAERVKLDALVGRFQAAKFARRLLAPPKFLRRSAVNPTEAKDERKIHGSFTLSYGMGSGDYSEMSGSMVLRHDDPAGRYSIAVGYSETRIKGGDGYIYGDPFYRDPFYRDPFYRDPFYRDGLSGPLHPDPFYRDSLSREPLYLRPRVLAPDR